MIFESGNFPGPFLPAGHSVLSRQLLEGKPGAGHRGLLLTLFLFLQKRRGVLPPVEVVSAMSPWSPGSTTGLLTDFGLDGD